MTPFIFVNWIKQSQEDREKCLTASININEQAFLLTV